ncbi:MAG: polysaccharide biosynthesis C-terminal domain-containing protein, partial [Oscillospiraceae bacterium]|nr:polysaccharide biosynthesis C-terminal domain-containing protein [Oscillospiraceae bacterium]
DPAVIALSARYARIVAFCYFFSSTTQVYLAAHRSMANPKLGLYVLTVPMVCNTFFNWVFIFGKLGFPAMGVEGAALATLLSCVLQFVIVVVHALVSRGFRLRPALIFRPGREMARRYVRYAAPVVLNEALWGFGNSLYPTIMGHMEGSQAILAAHGLSGNIVNLASVMAFGVAGSVAIIVGREIGAGRKDTVYEVGLCLDTLAFLTGLVTGLAAIAVTFLVLRPYLYPLFDLSPEAGNIATTMLMVTFSTLSLRTFNSANVVGVLRGGGDVRMASVIDLSPLWLVAVPLAALSGLVFRWGILAVQISIAMENVVKFFLGVARLRSGAWIRDVTVS